MSTSGQVQLAGRVLRCRHCQGDRFRRGTAQLNTAGLTFLGLDWANRTATIYACETCGLIEWVAE